MDFGMGGGSVLILMLVNFLGIEQHIAQATNLIFFIPTAIIICIVNHKQKLIDYKIGIKIIIFGIIGAYIGAKLASIINSKSLKKYFGIFLLCMEIFEIITLIKEHKKKIKTNNINIKK